MRTIITIEDLFKAAKNKTFVSLLAPVRQKELILPGIGDALLVSLMIEAAWAFVYGDAGNPDIVGGIRFPLLDKDAVLKIVNGVLTEKGEAKLREVLNAQFDHINAIVKSVRNGDLDQKNGMKLIEDGLMFVHGLATSNCVQVDLKGVGDRVKFAIGMAYLWFAVTGQKPTANRISGDSTTGDDSPFEKFVNASAAALEFQDDGKWEHAIKESIKYSRDRIDMAARGEIDPMWWFNVLPEGGF